MTSIRFFNEGITLLDSTVASATTGSFVTFGGISIFNTSASTGITSGALVIAGGLGLGGTMYNTTVFSSGINTITNTTQATTTSTGALVVLGGTSIQKDLRVGGNTTITGDLFVNGTTTTVNSTTVSISDNTFQINSAPNSAKDSGFLIQRYQVDNDSGLGDVVSETAITSGTLGTGNTTSLVTLPAGFSAVDDFYNSFWIKITSGAANDEVRQITDYNGTTKVATLSSVLTSAPTDSTDTFSLYNKSYLVHYFDTASNEYIFGYTKDNIDITTNIYDSGLASLRSHALFTVNSTMTNLVATNVSAGSIAFSDATIGNLYVTNNGTINNSYLNNATVGSLWVNQRNVTPSTGDIIFETSYSASNNQNVATNVTGFAFGASVRSFFAHCSVTILTTDDLDNRYALYTLQGTQKNGTWVLNSNFIGDITGVSFSINSSGQIRYISTNVATFISDTMKFKANTTTV